MKFLNRQPGVFCLNKGWKFIEEDFSVVPPTKNHDDVYGFSKAGAAKGPADAGFDDSAWEDVNLPHDWVTKKEFEATGSPNQGYKERGTGWYRIRFELPETDMGKQILLEFEGMSCDSQIYVNGTVMKHNFSGYNSFVVDMTDMANFGITPNTLAIRVDASAWEGWWYEGAGIYRNVWLVKKAPVHLAYNGVFAKPVYQENKLWKLEISAEVENSFEYKKEFELESVLRDREGNDLGQVSLKGAVDGYDTVTVKGEIEVADPYLWSPENPYLYQVETRVKSVDNFDFLITDCGFRTIRLEAENGFWLNGENIKLKGFCNHQDHAGVGAAVPYSVKEFRVKRLKELGANAYRCAHNPDPEILEICDRAGLMVMEENRTFSSSEENLREIRGIVRNARNHPSVILYSVLNEEPLQGTVKGHRMAGRLQAAVKKEDDTRPVLGAFNGGYMEEEGAATVLESVGINYNPGRYDDFHQKYPNTPLIGSETASAFMVRGEYKTDKTKNIIDGYDEECALWGTTVRDTWKYVNERPFVAGSFVWTGFDYRGEPTPFEWPSVGTFFGTYDSCGFEKDACYFYKAFWKEEAMVHLVSPWKECLQNGEDVKVLAITNCEEVALYIDDVLVEKKAADQYEHVLFHVQYESGKVLKAVGYRNGNPAAEDVQETAGKAVTLRIGLDKNVMRADGLDAVVVNIYAVDEKDQIVNQADHLVTMDVNGGAKILGVGNGNPNSHEPDVAPYRKLYHGCCQMILGNCDLEDVTIRVSAEGLESASAEILVEQAEMIPYMKTVKERVVEGWGLFYKLFDEMPDPNIKVDANDMNSFEPVAFTGVPQPQLADQLNKYGLYRTVFDAGKPGEKRYIYFGDVKGHVWIYLDGQKVAERTDEFGGELSVELAEEMAGEHTLAVIIQNANREWPQAGICMPVTLKK